MDQPIWITLLVSFIILNVLLISMAYLTWFERKVLGRFQDRLGPTRTGPAGLLQPIADAVKLIGKEDLVPGAADKWVFLFAPVVSFMTALIGAAVIPWGDTITISGQSVNLYPADLNVGALFGWAVSGVGVYGIILGGWASSSMMPRMMPYTHHPRRLGVVESFFADRRAPVRGTGRLLRTDPGILAGRYLH